VAVGARPALLNTPPPRSFAAPRFRDYNPYNYTDALEQEALKEAQLDDDEETPRNGDERSGVFPAGGSSVLFLTLVLVLQAANRTTGAPGASQVGALRGPRAPGQRGVNRVFLPQRAPRSSWRWSGIS